MDEIEQDNVEEEINESFMKDKKEIISEIDNAREIENLKKIEAALFLSAKWLTVQELVTLTDINPILLRQLIERLKERYNETSAIDILNKEDMWKMDVKAEHVSMINRLATGSAEFSKAEQETLAVIAYKQPVKQSVIIKIRGNKAYEHIKGFISLGLIRAKKMGHTQELNLSDDFYNYFHVGNSQKNLDDLQGKEGDEIKQDKKEEG